MVRGVFVSRTKAETTLIKDVLNRFETEVLPTKRSEQSDKSRIKTLTDAFSDYRMASLTSSQVAQFRDCRLKVVENANQRDQAISKPLHRDGTGHGRADRDGKKV